MYIGINQRETNKLNFYVSKWILFCPYKLEFRIKNQSKFFSYISLVTIEIKLEMGLGIDPSQQGERQTLLQGKENVKQGPLLSFLLICFASRHGRWWHASINVSSCLNLHPRYTIRVSDKFSSEGFRHTFSKHLLLICCWSSTVLRAGHKLLTIVFSPALPEKRGKEKHQRDPQEIQYSKC